MSAFFDWASFTPASASADLERFLNEAERAVTRMEQSEPKTYEDLVWALDDATDDLWHCWGRVSHLLGVMNSEEWRKTQEQWQERIVAFSLRVSQSPALFRSARRLLAEGKDLDAVRRRILERMVQGAELSGVGLEGERKDRFNAIAARLAILGNDFHNAVIDATNDFSFEKDGKKYTIDDANYPETMKHCADAEVREKLYRARVVRAPENGARIAEILKLRQEEAGILGFANFAERSLATKCAPGVKSVYDMIDRIDRATKKQADEEERSLGEGPIAPWDRAYLAERLRERAYAYSEEELKCHFPFEDVLKGLFRITQELFGVTVAECTGEARPPVWHPDVRFFAVREGDETIAHFYLDPFVRNGLKGGGAWMNEFRNRRHRPGEKVVTPVAVIVLNLPVPDAAGRCLMPFREVETLFHEFGHALQCMLTRVDEEDAAGINLVEWDAVEVASQFMENWCLDDRTGLSVPEDLKGKVRAARNFRAATACRRQLAFAKTDLDLHVNANGGADADAVKQANFAHFGLPTIEGDLFLNAFTHIFAGGYAAGYYGYKWAEVMSADCYGAFEEAGLDDAEATVREGRRFRETVLALGGSESALAVFRRFRGRAPEIEALLRQQGIGEKE